MKRSTVVLVAVASLILGIACGAALHLPWMPAPFDSDTATLLGSLLGALLGSSLAVVGAEYLAYRRREQLAESAREAIAKTILPLQRAARIMLAHSNIFTSWGVRDEVDELLSPVFFALGNFEDFWKEARPICADLGADGRIGYVGIQRHAMEIKGSIISLQEFSGTVYYPDRLSEIRIAEAALQFELAKLGIHE